MIIRCSTGKAAIRGPQTQAQRPQDVSPPRPTGWPGITVAWGHQGTHVLLTRRGKGGTGEQAISFSVHSWAAHASFLLTSDQSELTRVPVPRSKEGSGKCLFEHSYNFFQKEGQKAFQKDHRQPREPMDGRPTSTQRSKKVLPKNRYTHTYTNLNLCVTWVNDTQTKSPTFNSAEYDQNDYRQKLLQGISDQLPASGYRKILAMLPWNDWARQGSQSIFHNELVTKYQIVSNLRGLQM